MPNMNEHIIHAQGITFCGAIIKTVINNDQHNLGGLLRNIIEYSIGGLVGAVLPDLLDIPDNPNHRGRFHSATALTGISSYLLTNGITKTGNGFLGGMGLGYIDHLYLDSQTPDGLPLI